VTLTRRLLFMVKALILDLDGTLVNSREAHIKSYQMVFKKKGLNPKYSDLKKNFGKVAEDIILGALPQLTAREVKEIVLEKREIFLNIMDEVIKEPCVDHFLKKASEDYALAIATSASRIEMKELIEKFGWTDYFKLMLTSYDVPEPKPAPDLLLAIAKQLGVKVSDCLFIGDSIFDAMAARKAGMSFLGVETGGFSKKSFKQEGFESHHNLCFLMRSFF